MPRARPPDARCLANATFPLLPFLAPRAFVESPFRRTGPGWVSGTAGSVPEKEDTVTIKKGSRLPDSRCNTQNIRTEPARRPLQSSFSAHCSRGVSLLHSSRGLSPRYADIFAFARGQVRNYATKRAERRARKVGRSQALRLIRAEPSKEGVVTGKIMHAVLAEHRRRKALKLTAARFKQYMSRRQIRDTETLALDGRYRSLTRRLFNYRRMGPGVFYTGVQESNLAPEGNLAWGLAALDRRVYPGVRRSCHFLELRHDVRCNDWISRLWQGVEIDGEERLYQNWIDMGDDLRNESWHLILLDLLDRRPSRALQFLKVLGQTLADSHAIFLVDAFEHLARRVNTKAPSTLVAEKTQQFDHQREQFVPAFWHTIGPHLERYSHLCSQDLLLNIARLATLEDLKTTFDHLVEKNVFLKYYTLLSYANIFAEHGEHQYALRCLNTIVKTMHKSQAAHTVGDKLFGWSCALILRKSLKDPDSYHMTSSIVAEFLRFGVKLDTLLYNVIIHNAMDAKDHATAFNVYNLLEIEGLEADEYTYNIMLHGCTVQDDPTMFREFAEYCRQKALGSRDPYLATNYLFYVARTSSLDTFSAASGRKVLDTFNDCFQSGALAPFLGSSPALKEGLLAPTIPAVFMVLQTMIKNAFTTGNQSVLDMYRHFIRIIQDGKFPILNELARGTYIWNAFLLAFCKGQQFANASHLIKMLSESKDPTLKLPQPDLISWNIFLAAFFKTDQVEAAERVFEIMRSRGVEPDQFTYSTLVLGYARAQHLGKVGQVLPFLDQKTQLAPILLSALAKMQQRGELMRRLEDSRVLRDRDEQRKTEDKQRVQEERWALRRLNQGTMRFSKPGQQKKGPRNSNSIEENTSESKAKIHNALSTDEKDDTPSREKEHDWKPTGTAHVRLRSLKGKRRGFIW
ncbi:hypothetical protein BDV96DRAFT_489521 [Lophiotrema nucula]|uniref:Pentacotripeptide-repeat region of PRORP domain-containing protein n=1 Tax=Lophiotrema nucula TaxID=690887 RepID=A0A6A5ZGL7_9PLEO|nr:hypothetical protein BDV96DRAFT_489521 [Lophiotrema nucula]